MKISRFEDIQAWKSARLLRMTLHAATRSPAFFEERDLRRQMDRAAVSIMANIAEGFDGGTDGEFRRFLRMAMRSITELQSHLYAALDSRCLSVMEFSALYKSCVEAKALVGGFIRYLGGKSRP